jgi:hypothetical protein
MNMTTSAPITVTVSNDSPGGGDPTAPTVTITSPSSGAWTGNSILVSASASDDAGVASITLWGNGASFGTIACGGTTCTGDIRWSTSTLPAGAYEVNAVATDTAGNCTVSSPVTINKNGTSPVVPSGATCGGGGGDTMPPSVAMSAPANGSTVSGTVTVSATASDNVGVVAVQFKLDGANLGGEDTTAPYSTPWDTSTAPSGSHTLTAVARDAAGNVTTSAPVTVTVGPSGGGDATPPTATITSPSSGAWTGNSILVSASASDNVGVTSITLWGDGAAFGTIPCGGTSCTGSIRWSTGALPTGAYQVNAVATDAAGNCTISAPVTINKNGTSPVKPSGANC